jgi:hypothetical protein
MAKFRVGQKVRVIHTKWPENGYLVGREGVVTGFGPFDSVTTDIRCELPGRGQDGVFGSEYLAPIYDGYDKVSWSECLWQPTPEKLVAKA